MHDMNKSVLTGFKSGLKQPRMVQRERLIHGSVMNPSDPSDPCGCPGMVCFLSLQLQAAQLPSVLLVCH